MSTLERTEEIVSAEELRKVLGLEDDDQIPTETVGVCAGEWRQEPDGRWRMWKDPDWEDDDYDDTYPPDCTDPGGHVFPTDIEEHERCLCIHCGADGDA